MRTIFHQLKGTFLELFPNTKYRLILTGLVLIAAFISVSELAVTKLFTKIILHEGELTKAKMLILVVVFFLFFGATRAGHFFQRIYRVNVFDKAFKNSPYAIAPMKENWRWSLAFELTTILGIITQLVVIVTFFTYLNWVFGLINLVVLAITFQLLGRLFKKQISSQRGFIEARRNKIPTSNFIRVGTRIKSGEIGILFSGIAMLGLLGVLLYLSFQDQINASNTIVLFFGLRMQNSSLSTLSTGLMRFARARTNSE